MADDTLLNDDDLLGLDDNDLLEEEDFDDSILDDDLPHKKQKLDDDLQPPTESQSKESVFSTATASSSAEKLEQEVMTDQLDYEDDLEEFDEKERRESKFASERTDTNKSKYIDELLPQQKGQRSANGKTSTAENTFKGKGNYRGRGRGGYRSRGNFRNLSSNTFGADRQQFYQNGMPFSINPAFPMVTGSIGSMMPNMATMDQNNWNKRVEAFMRQTSDSLGRRSRSYSVSSDGSSYSSYSSSSTDSRLSDRKNRGRRRERSNKNRTEEDKKAALECAEAIGLDEEYLKKVEEQKKLREEIQRKKARKFQEDENVKDESRKRNRSPERRRSLDRIDSDRSIRRRRRHKKHRRDRASSLERLAEQALKQANEAIKPLSGPISTTMTPKVAMPMNVNPMLPPLNVPPPPIPGLVTTVQPHKPINSTTVSIISQPKTGTVTTTTAATKVPTIRTVSTATVAGPMMPKIVTYQPPPDAKEKKLKAHLVVVVGNVGKLQNNLKRIALFASSVGDTKKVWQDDSNSVSIIFKKLEDAKKFLTQYHNQAISGVKLDVSLHKMYLNLDTMGK